eukprot:403341964
MDTVLQEIQSQLQTFQSQNPNFDLAASSNKNTKADNARINLAFAFGLNSLYYTLLRTQGSKSDVKSHPVLSQINMVREHYQKLEDAINPKKSRKERQEVQVEEKRGMMIDMEVTNRIVSRTVNENKRIIKQQELEELEAKRKRFKVSSTDFIDDKDDDSDNDEKLQQQ